MVAIPVAQSYEAQNLRVQAMLIGGPVWDSLVSESGKILGGVLAGALGVIWLKLKSTALDFLPAKAEFLNINATNVGFQARDLHESHDAALGIHIHHQGGPNCYVIAAAFKPARSFWLFRGPLPIYSGAFRSRRYKGAYELKFGPQWKDPDVLLHSGDRVMTYLPLVSSIPEAWLSDRTCGTIMLDYTTARKVGTHKSPI